MTKINFDLTEAIAKVQRQAELDIIGGIQRAGEGISRGLLNNGRYKAYGPEGLAHEIIRKKIEDYVLSDAFSQKLDDTIIRVMDEESEKALRVLLNSKTRKYLFQPTSPVRDERDPASTEKMWIYVKDSDTSLTWATGIGWVEIGYSRFSEDDKFHLSMPKGGHWVKI